MELDNKILVFIHVKKTGGISVQWLLAQQYGKRFYGRHTHSALRKVACINPLEETRLSKVPIGSCICKHWKYSDFKPIEDKCVFFTVLRDPVSRIVCHYNFYRKHYPKGVSFLDYIHQPENINRYVKALPPASKLSEVLLFEDLYNAVQRSAIMQVKNLPHKNRTSYKHEVWDSEIEVFRDLNREDLSLYEELKGSCV